MGRARRLSSLSPVLAELLPKKRIPAGKLDRQSPWNGCGRQRHRGEALVGTAICLRTAYFGPAIAGSKRESIAWFFRSQQFNVFDLTFVPLLQSKERIGEALGRPPASVSLGGHEISFSIKVTMQLGQYGSSVPRKKRVQRRGPTTARSPRLELPDERSRPLPNRVARRSPQERQQRRWRDSSSRSSSSCAS